MIAGELLRKVYDYLGQANYSTVTGSGTTTITDSGVVDLYPDGAWDNGGFFVSSVALGADPEGQFARISTYDGALGQFVLADALTVAVPAGATYAWASSLYPVNNTFALMTEALRRCGDLPFSTTLAVTSGVNEYDLPVTLKKRRIASIGWREVSGDTPVPILDYKTRQGDPGLVGVLLFPRYIPTGTCILEFFGEHPEITSYSDHISESLDSNLLILSMAISALEWQIGRTQGAEDYIKSEYNKAVDKFDMRMATNGPELPIESPELFTPGRDLYPLQSGW